MAEISVRKGMPSVQLDQQEFKRRYLTRFYDPAFDALKPEIDRIADVAWKCYEDYNKSPRTRKAGPGFADPNYDLPVEWLAASEAVQAAERKHKDPASPSRILLVNGSSRSEHTCPGEMSKTFRLVDHRQTGDRREPRLRSRSHRPVASRFRIRPRDLSLQGLRLDRGAAVSLALQLLPQPRARPGRRLDERDLSEMGGGARRHDRDAR